MEKWNHGKKDAGGDRILSRRKNDLKGMPGIVLIERVKQDEARRAIPKSAPGRRVGGRVTFGRKEKILRRK
jgi:hypothetical protein